MSHGRLIRSAIGVWIRLRSPKLCPIPEAQSTHGLTLHDPSFFHPPPTPYASLPWPANTYWPRSRKQCREANAFPCTGLFLATKEVQTEEWQTFVTLLASAQDMLQPKEHSRLHSERPSQDGGRDDPDCSCNLTRAECSCPQEKNVYWYDYI